MLYTVYPFIRIMSIRLLRGLSARHVAVCGEQLTVLYLFKAAAQYAFPVLYYIDAVVQRQRFVVKLMAYVDYSLVGDIQQCVFHVFRCGLVQRAGHFVEQQYLAVPVQRSCKVNAQLFSARHLIEFLVEYGVFAFGQSQYKVV